jgi:hypothetical protein
MAITLAAMAICMRPTKSSRKFPKRMRITNFGRLFGITSHLAAKKRSGLGYKGIDLPIWQAPLRNSEFDVAKSLFCQRFPERNHPKHK